MDAISLKQEFEKDKEKSNDINYTQWLENKIIGAKDFEFISRQILKYLNENHHPHTSLYSDGISVDVSESSRNYNSNEYVVD